MEHTLNAAQARDIAPSTKHCNFPCKSRCSRKCRNGVEVGSEVWVHQIRDNTEVFGLAGGTTSKADENTIERCIQGALEGLPGECKRISAIDTPSVVNVRRDADLRLAPSEKEDSFVVIPSAWYNDGAGAAFQKSYCPAQIDPSRAHREGLKHCQGEALSDLETERPTCSSCRLSARPRRTRRALRLASLCPKGFTASTFWASFYRDHFHRLQLTPTR